MRLAVLSTLLALQAVALAANASAADDGMRSFEVPAGTASETLKSFARQAHREIMFPAEPMGGIRTNAVKGEFTVRAALDRMLSGTPLRATEDEKTGALAVVCGAPAGTRPAGASPANSPSDKKKANMTTQRSLIGWLAALFVSVSPANLPAQGAASQTSQSPGPLSAPASSFGAAASPAEMETIKLDEFDVSASRVSGYRAAGSITATGIGSQIMDVPLPINVVTSEFLADTAGLQLMDAMTYVPGVIIDPRDESNFSLRGWSGLESYRNGFFRRTLLTTWNVDRVEVIKGASGIFFGDVRPGGVINYITTKPVLGSSFADLKVTIGSGDFHKGELFLNQPVNDKLAFRIGLGGILSHGDKEFYWKRESYLGLSVLWRPTKSQELTVDLETIGRKEFYVNAYGGTAVTASQYLFNPAAITPSTAYQTYLQQMVAAQMHVPPSYVPLAMFTNAWIKANLDPIQATAIFLAATGQLANVNDPIMDSYGPIYGTSDPLGYGVAMVTDAKSVKDSHTIDVGYLAKITDNLVWQTALNYGYEDQTGLQPYTTSSVPLFIPYADGSLKFRVQYWQNIRNTYNINNKLTWRFDLGPSRNTWLVGEDCQIVVLTRPGYMDGGNNFSQEGVLSSYVWNHPGVDAPVSAQALIAGSSQWSSIINQDTTNITEGYYFAGQSRFFAERLLMLYGVRYNVLGGHVDFSHPVANSSLSSGSPGGLSSQDRVAAQKAWTPQIGALLKIWRGLSVFGVYSTATEGQNYVDYSGQSGQPVKNKNYDIGLKTDLINGRLGSTITYYRVDRTNLAYEDVARESATGKSPWYIFGNSEMSKGWEADINFAPVDGDQLIFGWSHILDAKVAVSNDPTFVGLPLSYMPKDTVDLWDRYDFKSGLLKGLTIGAGIRHNTSARMYSNPELTMVEPGFTTFDAMASYKLRVFQQDFDLQANVKNLQNKLYREGIEGYFDPKRAYYISVKTRF